MKVRSLSPGQEFEHKGSVYTRISSKSLFNELGVRMGDPDQRVIYGLDENGKVCPFNQHEEVERAKMVKVPVSVLTYLQGILTKLKKT